MVSTCYMFCGFWDAFWRKISICYWRINTECLTELPHWDNWFTITLTITMPSAWEAQCWQQFILTIGSALRGTQPYKVGLNWLSPSKHCIPSICISNKHIFLDLRCTWMTVATCWEKMSNSLISAGIPGPSSRWANRASLKKEKNRNWYLNL